ncbi:MAG: hypothetical protein M1296_05830 [Chloroflexi bacterium]|nr:hypothetical protein [Chloroflexota bacterium]
MGAGSVEVVHRALHHIRTVTQHIGFADGEQESGLPVKDNQPALEAGIAGAFSPLLALTPDPTVPPVLPI